MFRWACCGLVVLLAAPVASAAPPKDVAEMFPPGTLVFAELHKPGELGPQLGPLLKGSVLDGRIPFLHGTKENPRLRSELTNRREFVELALLVTPEVLAEFNKLGGVAVGLTGFNSRGEPEVALAVLTGTSAAAEASGKAFFTKAPNIRKVTEVSKVPVYQYALPNERLGPGVGPPGGPPGGPGGLPVPDGAKAEKVKEKGKEQLAPEGPYERTYAHTPGLFVVGTSKAAIAPIIQRFVGDEKESLRGADGFQAATKEDRQPGLFFYADAPALFAKLDAAARAREEYMESDWLAWLRIVVGQKPLKWIAGCAHFRDGGLALSTSLKLDAMQTSPLAEFLSGTGAKVEGLHHARKPASAALTIKLPEKDRAAAIIGLLDAQAKTSGEIGRLPGDILKDLEKQYKLAVRDTLLAKLRAVTVIVPAKQELPKGAAPMPMLVLHLDDEAAATTWDEFLPKLVAEIAGGKPAQPARETIGGMTVLSLPATGLPWNSPVHYARSGSALAIGQDRKLVAQAATADAKSSVLGGDKPLSLPAGEFALVGTMNLGALLGTLDLPDLTDAPRLLDLSRERSGLEPLLPPAGNRSKDTDKARAAFVAAFNQLPPATVTVRRTGDELKLDIFQPKVQPAGLTPVINAGVQWLETLLALRGPNDGYPVPRPYYGLDK